MQYAYFANKDRNHYIITTQIEHSTIMNTFKYMETSPIDVESAITDYTILISVMLANNEVSTVQRIAEIAEIVR